VSNGPFIFLGAFASLALSWLGLVLAPQLQLGSETPQRIEDLNLTYPAARAGLAQQGAEIYRQLGCNHCHSQQVQQESVAFGVRLNELGETPDAVYAALVKAGAATGIDAARTLAAKAPVVLFEGLDADRAAFLSKTVADAGAKAEVIFQNLGADIARGWGVRLSASQDYLFDSPVLTGDRRAGPDLANLGARLPENYATPWKFASTNTVEELREWHFKHLADPRSVTPSSTMPAYTWLFEKRGDKTVPSSQAEALVAYLLSLRQDVPLANAPLPRPVPAPAASTNAPAK
jgi:cbb3-type cytochrome oxidase cytochrome c subunit